MMSMNEFEEAMKNEAMKREYEAYIDEKKPETLDALIDTVVGFAAAKGFGISKEDVMSIIPDELKSGDMELSDDILDAVVGGSYDLRKSASLLIVLLGSNYGDKISLTFGECIKDNVFTLEFAKVLREEGVDYQMEQVVPRAPLKHKSDRLYKK